MVGIVPKRLKGLVANCLFIPSFLKLKMLVGIISRDSLPA
jgi:hypothetical protein